jgi:hypothetical protein
MDLDCQQLDLLLCGDKDEEETKSNLNHYHVVVMQMMMSYYEENLENIDMERLPMMVQVRLCWDKFWNQERHRVPVKRHLRMEKESFELLLSFLYDDLEVDILQAEKRGGAIIPQISLYCCIRFLCGASYTDICLFACISQTGYYNCVWKTIFAINKTEEICFRFPKTAEECLKAAEGFASISSNSVIDNCVGVLDGYHMEIITPSSNCVNNVRSFFSRKLQNTRIECSGLCGPQL